MRIRIVASLFIVMLSNRFSATTASSRANQAQSPSCGQAIECQKAAKAAFDREMARVGKDCVHAGNQREENICQNAAAAASERNFGEFYSALEGIVGSAGLRESQQAWLDYRKKQCDAIFDFFRPGTIAPSAESRCEIELTRSRMRDLDVLYETPLHH